MISVALAAVLIASAVGVANASEGADPVPADIYGGLPVPVGPGTGFFRVAKVGPRWTFVTPAGNAFWLRGVYAVGIGDGGPIADKTFRSRFNQDQFGFTTRAARRLKSWGFNAIGPYSSSYAGPIPVYLRRDGNPEKLPVISALNISLYGSVHEPGTTAAKWHLAPAPFKTILAGGVDEAIYKGWPGHTPDVFDANFETFARNLAADLRTQSRQTAVTGWDPKKNTWITTSGGLPHPVLSTTPWLLGITPDDVDFVFGFGPGPEVPGFRGVVHPHIGWIVAVTRPEQRSNSSVGVAFGSRQTITYADPVVYAKRAWRDYLLGKYRTIEALNLAWGSKYTTFDSDGGWPHGRGLLDESGRNPWIGRDSERLSETATAAREDLDAFLEIYATQYFRTVSAAVRAAIPHHLVFSPAMLNGHKGLTRRPILRAAGRHVDVIEINHHPEKPELIDITFAETGQKPLFSWVALTANADSAMHAHEFAFGLSLPTQQARAARYARVMDALLRTSTRDGTLPIVGFLWWEYMDKWGERSNWGLVSSRDNAYDGREAVRALGNDRWGFQTGGEDRDYGDFLSGVSQTNRMIDGTLVRELREALTKLRQ